MQFSNSHQKKISKGNCGTGLIANMSGTASHEMLLQGLQILRNLEHRGATGQDPLSGDGAGILVEIPDSLFRRSWGEKIELPELGSYAVGVFFFSQDKKKREQQKLLIEKTIPKSALEFLCWRKVPTNNQCLSKSDLNREPHIFHLFVTTRNPTILAKKVYLLRKKISKIALCQKDSFFDVISFSSDSLLYKGLFLAGQLADYFLDLKEEDFKTSFALVHQRYSTNTLPSWKLAQPFRLLAHNGEINTIIGNINGCNAREWELQSEAFGKDFSELLPIIEADCSDSLAFDNFLEFLVASGVPLLEAMMIMIPRAWENNPLIPKKLKAFYEYFAPMVEAWDGPVSMVFADKNFIGATVDRNGLRPLRYCQTVDKVLVVASESGVIPFSDIKIQSKGKLGAGEILAIDRQTNQLLKTESIHQKYSEAYPYLEWNQKNKVYLKNLKGVTSKPSKNPEQATVLQQQRAFSYSEEELQMLLKAMSENSEELVYAMGNDTPLSVLSEKPKLLFTYFKQRFAQVTNPPMDPIREDCNMSLQTYIADKLNPCLRKEIYAKTLVLESPILNSSEFSALAYQKNFPLRSLDITYPKEKSLQQALDQLCNQAATEAKKGILILVLSDANIQKTRIPIPSLLATAAVHHHLIKQRQRGKLGIVVQTGEARETHHFALLLGYGACAVYPYLAYATIEKMRQTGQIKTAPAESAQQNYIKAAEKGIKKIMSKMGISTLNSYQGAQIFEAVGLNKKLLQKYFCGTHSPLDGMDLKLLEKESLLQHHAAWEGEAWEFPADTNSLFTGGEYNWRVQGERHAYNPQTIHLLQQAAWKNDYSIFKEFTKQMNELELYKIRNLLDFTSHKKPIAFNEVESESEIVKRFCTGAMSIGAISKEAHEDLAIAMNRLGARSNTGEGGESAARYVLDKDGNSRNSSIKQVASGRFGVTSYYLSKAKELQIKIAQGAKPGEGGQLKGFKVDAYIAELRHTIEGVPLISPPPHHDIYSIEDLAQLIYDLKNASPKAEVSVKLVASEGVGTVAYGVAKGKADRVVIAGYDGGTGASPASSIKHAGIPWEIGIAETQQVLMMNGIRDRVRLQVDGQITTGKGVVIGALLGAEEFGFSTSALVTQGCILMRKCHLNTCPVGIATQDPMLRKKFKGKPEYVINFFLHLAKEVREIMAQLGVKKFDDLIGQTEFLKIAKHKHNLKSRCLDFSPLLYKVKRNNTYGSQFFEKTSYRKTREQDNLTSNILDNKLIQLAQPALEEGKKVRFGMCIKNTQRTVGTMLGYELTKRYAQKGLPDDTICADFCGTAGQSLGAFLPKGISLRIQGDANDYLGKGLCGGKIVLSTAAMRKVNPTYIAQENTIVGNTVLYGATSGKVFLNGAAGERFAVRNSGAYTVVEGVGEHGCEYMTGGVVIVLGKVGRNFAAGMSGGYAYVYQTEATLRKNCNLSVVEVLNLGKTKKHGEKATHLNKFWELIEEHYLETESVVAKEILADKDTVLKKFCWIVPKKQEEKQERPEQNKKSPIAIRPLEVYTVA